ncbi:hypothetical protein DC094_11750 [Pelagibaculum spongiae]|uniref:Uncharacterized protein n=2 Tax=Pelagibaculum spongiae TaxID=2080658 RepID=A0A2V1H0U3_9GAMM|nr:hypothetical protein DC094_11750 [Pelagibaculum spongiae]
MLPLYIPLRFLYANKIQAPINILYTCYRNKKEYDAIIANSTTEELKNLKSWEEWQHRAKAAEAEYSNEKHQFIKVIIRPIPLQQWLISQQLENNCDNRERYVEHVFNIACQQGIELTSQCKY